MSLSRRRLRTTALILAVALIAAACGSSARHNDSHGHSTPEPARLISIFEPRSGLITNPKPILDELRRLGAQYVRVAVFWRSVAPAASSATAPVNFDAASPAAYPAANWASYDALDRDARAYNIGVIFDVGGAGPRWATGPGFTPGGASGVWRPSATAFGPFVRAVGTRYSGHYTPPGARSPLPRVSFWSIWNEPNLGEADLAPQAVADSTIDVSPAMYRHLLDAGWTGLHQSGHGGDTILIGELAPYGQSVGNNVPGTFGYMVPMRFLRALYCVDSSLRPLRGSAATARDCPGTASGSRSFASQHPALFDASGFGIHPYPSGGVAPNVVLPGEPDFVYLATLSRLTGFLDHVTALYGVGRHFPLYSTEYGYKTNPPFEGGAPLNLAAAYLNWAEYLSWRNPRVRSWDQYLLADPPPGAPSKFVTGLEFGDGRPKPSYYAFRLPIYLPSTAEHGTGRLEVWGCVRPAYFAPPPQRAQIQLQPGGHGSFKTIATVTVSDSNCYFDERVRFPSGGNVRLSWSYPRGPVIYSRLVAITVS